MGSPLIFNGSNAKMLPTGNILDSTGTLYQRYLQPVYQTSGATAAINTNYLCNTTSAGFTMTLPAGAAGSMVAFTDDAGTWATNNLTIAPHTGETIQGISGNGSLVCNLNNASVQLIWDSTNSYWVVRTNGFQYGPTYVPGTTGGILPSAGVPGSTSGSAIASGYVGQLLSQTRTTGSALTLSSGTAVNLTSSPLSLTPGVWMISASAFFNLSSTMTIAIVGLSMTSGTMPGVLGVPDANGQFEVYNLTGSGSSLAQTVSIPTYYLNISSPVTLYLVVSSTFSGSNTASGFVEAVRIA